MKKLKDIIENKDYPVIERRSTFKDNDGRIIDYLSGFCSYENGKLSSLDGDDYSLDDDYIKWEKSVVEKDTTWNNRRILPAGTNYLTVWEDMGLD